MSRTLLTRRLRRGRSAALLVVTAAVLLAGGLDWYVRNDSMGRFLVTAEGVDATLSAFLEDADVFARSVQDGVPSIATTGHFQATATEVRGRVAEQCASLQQTVLLPWHTALRAARDTFVTHCLAWVDFLGLLSADWRNLFAAQPHLATSFNAAEKAAERAVPPVPLHRVRERVSQIFAD